MSGDADIRKWLEDQRVWVLAARVALHSGETSHYFVNEEGDVVVSCITHHHEQPVNANLGALVGGNGQGVFVIPDLGVEVLIGFDNGDFEAEAYIAGYATSGKAPAGLVPGKVFVLGMTVEVRSPNGTANPVATLADVQNLRDAHNGHTHLSTGLVAPSGGGPVTGTTAGPSSTATVHGTNVLKAE